jgi:hypothetical protein
MAEIDLMNLVATIAHAKIEIRRLNDMLINRPDDARSRTVRDDLQDDLEMLENEKNEHFKGLSMMHILTYRQREQNVRHKQEWENEIRTRLDAMLCMSFLVTQIDLRDLDKLRKCAHDIQIYLFMRDDPDFDFAFLKDQYSPQQMEECLDRILDKILYIRKARAHHVLLPRAGKTQFDSLGDDLRLQIARLSLDQDPL